MFTCKRAREVWKSLGLDDLIRQAAAFENSRSVVLQNIFRSLRRNSPVLGQLGLHETIVVAGWFIRWQRKQAVRGEHVPSPSSSAFSINGLTLNFRSVRGDSTPHENNKPPPKSYKLNVDALFFP
uniref:Uncharacterized protein n=1 Tax=Avena sativa TaxID=4498 RepID=A0ACD5XCK5_AVESA